jgi:CDGSH-type Zn-finger protein
MIVFDGRIFMNNRNFTDKSNSRFRIKVVKNGPYIASGGIPLTDQMITLDDEGQCLGWRETKRYPEQKNYSLCRCGHSKNKPFCDSSHKQAAFDGSETASHQPYSDQCQKYSGPTLDLTDARPLCVHAGFCDRDGGTWDLVSHSDNPEARKTAIEEGCTCPSGRLVIWDKQGNLLEPVLEPSIGLVQLPTAEFTSTIWVRGGIPVVSANGETYEIRNRVTLCGCGKSSNKPFCDGTHRKKKPE